jgi:hypothetical protein
MGDEATQKPAARATPAVKANPVLKADAGVNSFFL